MALPLDMTQGPLTIEFDAHLRVQDFHPYMTNFVTEGVGGLRGKGIFAFNVDSEVLGFEHDKVLVASANPEPNISISSDKMHHFKYVFTPTAKEGQFDFLILVDDGVTGKAEGRLNTGALDPSEVYLYFEVEHDDWPINEFIYLDNVLITSDAIEGNIGPAPSVIEPAGKWVTRWGGIKSHR